MKKLIEDLIPGGIKKAMIAKAVKTAFQQSETAREQTDAALPKIELQPQHIRNLRVLLNRQQLLETLPKSGVVAEIGVDTGGFSQRILDTCTPQKLHLVDAWDTTRYGEDKAQAVAGKFETEIRENRLQIHRGYSTDRASDFTDGYFDWIYIDTDHSYATTKAELEWYAPKIKPGGIMAGHDFVTGNWITTYRYGVREAVYEFCVKEGWELLYITLEIGDNASFAIRKI